jgi:hypothetical protein
MKSSYRNRTARARRKQNSPRGLEELESRLLLTTIFVWTGSGSETGTQLEA